MFVIREVKADAEKINVDGVIVDTAVFAETKTLATAAGKTHFIGVVQYKDPNFKHPYAGMSTAEFWKHWNGKKLEGMFLPVTEYVISDDRDAVLVHGCGQLVWVSPDRAYTVTPTLAEDRKEYQVIKCACCNADIPITNGSTQETAAQIERGHLAAQNREGTLTPDELASRENIKFGIYVCLKCFMEDPDLCRFFNKIGFTVR